jgi:hypothetical protein
MYITRLASKEIFSPSNKIHWEVGRAKDLSAPLDRRVGPQRQSGRGAEILASPEFDPHIVQPIASRNTDYIIPTPKQRVAAYPNNILEVIFYIPLTTNISAKFLSPVFCKIFFFNLKHAAKNSNYYGHD